MEISGWTTDPDHYIRIYTTSQARHDGTPGSGYRLAPAAAGLLTIGEAHVRIKGLELVAPAGADSHVLRINAASAPGRVGGVVRQNGLMLS